MPEVMIPGPAGDIEAVFTDAGGDRAAVLCHPHPQYGGSMNDMVIAALETVLQRAGIATLRFNFRGVGRSAGSYDNGAGETDDLRAAIAWLKEGLNRDRPVEQLLLVGYSFGGAVVLNVEAGVGTYGLILAAPGVGLLGDVPPPTTPALVIVGDEDQFFSEQMLKDHFDESTTCFEVLKGADHFSLAIHERLGPVVKDFVENL